MRYVRVTGRPDPAVVSSLFTVLADSDVVEESRLVEWNLASSEGVTVLFELDADADAVRGEFEGRTAVERAELRSVDSRRCYLLLTLRPTENPLVREMFRTVGREGLVVVKPVVYRDGHVHARFVGDAGAIQSALDSFPAAVDVTVHAIGEFHAPMAAPPGTLSDRQRAAVEVALDLGYYDHPRDVTLADVAAALDCATSTAAEHLQKAEAKLVRAGIGPS